MQNSKYHHQHTPTDTRTKQLCVYVGSGQNHCEANEGETKSLKKKVQRIVLQCFQIMLLYDLKLYVYNLKMDLKTQIYFNLNNEQIASKCSRGMKERSTSSSLYTST